MSRQKRQECLRHLEEVRGSRVLVHFLSDRRTLGDIPIPGLRTQLGGEAYPLIFKHLREMGKVEKLDLFLHTSGGAVDSVWPLVQLCRSFGREFTVIVPLRALSSGTLLCLGADQIMMTAATHLSPVDPTTQNAFNPRTSEGHYLPISVEDVTSYFQLATDSGGDDRSGSPKEARAGFGLKSDDHILEVFRILAQQVHPLALGNVKRVHTQIRSLARQLLELHVDDEDGDTRIQQIVRTLTQELFSHGHMINRDEAMKLLGSDIVRAPSDAEENAIWCLYEEYEDFFKLGQTFSVKEWLGADIEKTLSAEGAVIESTGGVDVYRAESRVRQVSEIPSGVQVQIPPGQRMPLIPGLPTGINFELLSMGWYRPKEE